MAKLPSHIMKRRMEDLVLTNLPEWGYNVEHWDLSTDDDGNFSLFVNLDRAGGAHVAGDRAFFISAIRIENKAESNMYTQSNFGDVDSRYATFPLMRLLSESPASFADDQAQVLHDVMHIMRGIFSARGKAYFTAAATLPTIKGINGAGASTDLSTLVSLDIAPAPRATSGGA